MSSVRHYAEDHDHLRNLVEHLTFEVVPMKRVDEAVTALPPRANVAVTCSPVKGIDATIELTDKLRAAGHNVTPHLAARMVEGPEHVARIAGWLRTEGIGRLFLVGGDAPSAIGPYPDGLSFLTALLDHGPEVDTIGVPAYPDGHPAIDPGVLRRALHAKQHLLGRAGVAGFVSTQMCFDPETVSSWLIDERNAGLELPVHLGLPGVVERAKLMRMGVRLGIGASLRYLKKNRRVLGTLMAPGDYDPSSLLIPLAPHLQPLSIEGIHCFTFNQVAATDSWRTTAGFEAAVGPG